MGKKRGFSIIEVAISLTLLALVFSGMFAVFDRGFLATRKSRLRTIAYSLIREKLEEKSAVSVWPPTAEPMAAVSGFAGFEREVVVTTPYLGFNDLAQITVTVRWDNGTQSQSINTAKANF